MLLPLVDWCSLPRECRLKMRQIINNFKWLWRDGIKLPQRSSSCLLGQSTVPSQRTASEPSEHKNLALDPATNSRGRKVNIFLIKLKVFKWHYRLDPQDLCLHLKFTNLILNVGLEESKEYHVYWKSHTGQRLPDTKSRRHLAKCTFRTVWCKRWPRRSRSNRYFRPDKLPLLKNQ